MARLLTVVSGPRAKWIVLAIWIAAIFVPVLVLDIGPKTWWPSSIARGESGPAGRTDGA